VLIGLPAVERRQVMKSSIRKGTLVRQLLVKFLIRAVPPAALVRLRGIKRRLTGEPRVHSYDGIPAR
jgi:hypothetical protein